ncbi:MAG: protein-L-isoaspartate O-methyltransferase [Candidatus Pacearchaeota archaeon]
MQKKQLIEHLKRVGFPKSIIDAFSLVKREDFVTEDLKDKAYEDTALPIGYGQTISQPYTIALMLSELDLKPGQKVLEAGSGSGYVLALISKIVGRKGRVFGLEIVKDLVKKSRENLESFRNVKIFHKNAINGLPDEAPFDRILISAAVRDIPQSLLNQLKNNGILVAPRGPVFEQNIVVIQKKGDNFITKSEIPGFVFVPLIESNQ